MMITGVNGIGLDEDGDIFIFFDTDDADKPKVEISIPRKDGYELISGLLELETRDRPKGPGFVHTFQANKGGAQADQTSGRVTLQLVNDRFEVFFRLHPVLAIGLGEKLIEAGRACPLAPVGRA